MHIPVVTNFIYDNGGFDSSKLGWRSDVPMLPKLSTSVLITRVGETENCDHNVRAMRYINKTDFERGRGPFVELPRTDGQSEGPFIRGASMNPASDIVSSVRYIDDDVLHPITACP